jgi:1,4-dihydroxy-2-naphthoate octaprenyltransferase
MNMENGVKGSLKVWLLAARPRTLILAISCTGTGLFLAAADDAFDGNVAGLTLLTAALLQVLSNLANDYGDTMHGADHGLRSGPSRAVQSGRVSAGQMRAAIVIVAAAATASGLSLLWLALGIGGLMVTVFFVLLGALAIWAAIAYTAGSLPYGYAGLGDAAVLVFFGWVGVLGSYFLQTRELSVILILPATSSGLFAVGVLNVNNIRDIESDRKAGKKSVPVRLGLHRARRYHWGLLLGGFAAATLFVISEYRSPWQLIFLASLPLLLQNGRAVSRRAPEALDPYLGQLSISTLAFALLFGFGQLLAG